MRRHYFIYPDYVYPDDCIGCVQYGNKPKAGCPYVRRSIHYRCPCKECLLKMKCITACADYTENVKHCRTYSDARL